MKNKRFWDVLLKVIVAAITAAATALGTTSCMGFEGDSSSHHGGRHGAGNNLVYGIRTVLN